MFLKREEKLIFLCTHGLIYSPKSLDFYKKNAYQLITAVIFFSCSKSFELCLWLKLKRNYFQKSYSNSKDCHEWMRSLLIITIFFSFCSALFTLKRKIRIAIFKLNYQKWKLLAMFDGIRKLKKALLIKKRVVYNSLLLSTFSLIISIGKKKFFQIAKVQSQGVA